VANYGNESPVINEEGTLMAKAQPRRLAQDKGAGGQFLSHAETGARRTEAFSNGFHSREALSAIDNHDWSGGGSHDPFAGLKAAAAEPKSNIKSSVPTSWAKSTPVPIGERTHMNLDTHRAALFAQYAKEGKSVPTLSGSKPSYSEPADEMTSTSRGEPYRSGMPALRAAEPTAATPHVAEAQSRSGGGKHRAKTARQIARWGTMDEYRAHKANWGKPAAPGQPGIMEQHDQQMARPAKRTYSKPAERVAVPDFKAQEAAVIDRALGRYR